MIVVTGATGNVGQPLVRALAEAGEEVTTISRTPQEPRKAGAPTGTQHRQADLTDTAGLKTAFEGAEALFLLLTGEWLAAGGDPSGILDAARSAGVRRIVHLSSQGVGTHRHSSHIEDAIKRSGLEWTMLRPGGFSSNTFQWAESIRTQRTVTAPFADVALPLIDPSDIAEAAAVTLRETGHGSKTYELTGPAPVSPRQQTAAIAEALGEPVRFVEQSHEEARTQMLRFMPEPVVDATLGILGTPSPAEQRVSPDAEHLLGRPPRTFAAWAARNTAAFR
ncbi:NAD(P)H-binding protein [Streptomyces sp. NPDC006283]|uniref:NAD(P)H-binding protein n=1 Tax=Streptomyces sp. NPDC006283 TaxID=3156741 RepID=UPI0033AC0071